MSISTKFQNLINNLRISNADTISTRYKAITKRLNLDFWESDSEKNHSRYVGSIGRGTAIKGVSDIDMIMRLPKSLFDKYNAYQTNGQSALLQAVKNSIKKTYSNTEIGGDGQVVVVQFSNKMKFEVVPVFKKTDGDYFYPDANGGGSWKITNPVAEIEAINDANSTYNGKIKHLGKMARAWKEKCNVQIPGILIDTLAFNFMKQWAYNDKSYMYYHIITRDFLKYLSEQNIKQNHWHAPGSRRYAYRSGKFEPNAKSSYSDAIKALEYESNRKEYSSNQEWKKIYGAYFNG